VQVWRGWHRGIRWNIEPRMDAKQELHHAAKGKCGNG